MQAFKVFPEIGSYGLAAVFENEPGKTVLRADIDRLPVEEKTGLPYASKARMFDTDGIEKPVMHACGHDMHITSLLAAAETLVRAKEEWKGTLLLVFQPAEEKGAGARAMANDGLYKKVPVPDVAIGAHVMPYRTGMFQSQLIYERSFPDVCYMILTVPRNDSYSPWPYGLCSRLLSVGLV